MVAITYGVARAAIAAVSPGDKSKGFFTRLYDALIEARTRQAEREIAMHRHLNRAWEKEILAAKGDDLPFGHRD